MVRDGALRLLTMRVRDLHRCRNLPLLRERPEHALDQRGIAIFLDLLDPAVLDAPDHAVVIVVALARPGDIVAARFDHHIVILRDEIERQRARPRGEERSEMAYQAVVDGVRALELMRPGILA